MVWMLESKGTKKTTPNNSDEAVNRIKQVASSRSLPDAQSFHRVDNNDVEMRDSSTKLVDDGTHPSLNKIPQLKYDCIKVDSNGAMRKNKPQQMSTVSFLPEQDVLSRPGKRTSDMAGMSEHAGRVSPSRSDRSIKFHSRSSEHNSPRSADVRVYSRDQDYGSPDVVLIKDLETRPITLHQLLQEVKGIYAGLVMVEKKCIEIVSQQVAKPTKLTKEQWQALIALHRTLLNEHHDFFSASHHPITKGSGPDGADHELRGLAQRYSMAARMWRHGIHALLELLRHRLPESLDYILLFVCLAYSMIGLLLETVPDFRETWIECLGDLARYRMAIEEIDVRDRQVWSETARTWYNNAADLSPNTGRIPHHLAVLARPNIVQQLYLYTKSLVASIPFKNAAESILLLFNPLLDQNNMTNPRYPPAESALVCAAAVLFTRRSVLEFQRYRTEFTSQLEAHMSRTGSRFKTQGPEIAGALFAMLMDTGNSDNKLWMMLEGHSRRLKEQYCFEQGVQMAKLPKDFIVQDKAMIKTYRDNYWSSRIVEDRIPPATLSPEDQITTSEQVSSLVVSMLYETISSVTNQIGNKNMVPFMYMVLAHLVGLTFFPKASVYVEAAVPWDKLVQFLNTIAQSNNINFDIIESDDFPKSFGAYGRQLPEEFVMRGLHVMPFFFPSDWFQVQLVDEDERLLENPSHQAPRIEKCLWAGVQLARVSRWIIYDQTTKAFTLTSLARSLIRIPERPQVLDKGCGQTYAFGDEVTNTLTHTRIS